ncbi:hypothetical protein [Saccharothrix xinjiangensis]|uniref:Uncharacterized protein n=1 Tax=Saccharothrix xinjiangensis TaxID=204798 RepID=A0ABV9Y1I8_9PSEU
MATSLDELERAVDALVTGSGPGRTFAMAPDALGSEGIRALVADSFPLTGGEWVLTAVDGPDRRGDAVVLTGTSTALLGLDAPRLELTFDLADQGRAALLVVLTPDDWNPGVSFPSWRQTAPALVDLVFDRPRLEWSSTARPTAEAGLNLVADEVLKQGSLASLATFRDLRLLGPRGPVGGGDAPTALIATRPPAALSVGGLSLPLTFTAIAAAEPGPCLGFDSDIAIGHGVPDVPVSARTGDLRAYLVLDADLTDPSRHALSAFTDFLHGAQVADLVRDVLTVPELIVLRHLSAVAGLAPARLASVALTVGTGQALEIIPGQVSVPDVELTFTVEDPAGSRDVSALLAGTFRFLDAYDVDVSAYYSASSIAFTGALDPDTPVPLSEVVREFLPNSTWLPDLTLNRLELSADLRSGQYSFGLAVADDWPVPVGAATFHLTGASLDLAYRSSAGFDGAITGQAALTGRGGEPVATFAASLAVRSTGFELKGEVAEVSLTALAAAFADAGVLSTSGLPGITLDRAAVVVRQGKESGREARLTGAASYEFSATASIDVAQFGQAHLVLAARRAGASAVRLAYAGIAADGTGQAGFLVGVVVAPDWNPGSIWSDLGGVFDHLAVREASLLLSTDRWTEPLPDLPDLPYPVEKGVTFAGSLLLQDALGDLAEVLPQGVELDLAARIDTTTPLDSDLRATLPHPGAIGSVEFTALVVTLAPKAFTLEADVKFTVHGETLHLAGRGVITLEPPALTLSITVEHWKNPFGIGGLTVDEFGLSLAVDSAGLTIGLLGRFLIGAGPDAFALTVGGEVTDFEEPSAFVFSLDPTSPAGLTLAQVVGQFTGTDLDGVPLLGDITIRRLHCYVVADPNGWTAPDRHVYPEGLGLDADLTFFDWTVEIHAVVGAKGIVASGSIVPAVRFGDLVELSDATGTTGPHVDIDTTVIGQPHRTYFDASGRIKLLGLTESFSGHADPSGFTFSFSTNLVGIFHTDVSASLSTEDGFTGSFSGSYEFDLTLQGDVTVAGITIIPKGVHVEGPGASLSVSCAVSDRAASLTARLHLTWSGVDLGADMDLAVSADVFTDLGRAIATWISGHAAEFFKALLDDVEKWFELLLKGVLWVGQSAVEVVEVLFTHFGRSVVDVAEDLLKLGKHSVEAMAQALVDVCGITMAEALKLLEKNCAITKAANAL